MLRFDETSNGAEPAFRTGEEFEIALAENRTTGFRWITDQQGEPACLLLEERSSAPSRPPGASGMHLWHFRAEHPGSGTICMRYQRPWEAERLAARTFRMQARVAD